MLDEKTTIGARVRANTRLFALSPFAPEIEAGTVGVIEKISTVVGILLFEVKIGERTISGHRLHELFDPV